MRFLSADYLYPLHILPIKEGVLQISNKGEVLSIIRDRSQIPKEKLEVFNGILCPGFVNVHCHLELSHLLGKMPQKIGLANFISEISNQRKADKENKKKAILKAHKLMIENGIVGAGDISNTTDSFFVKTMQEIKYHTFIEVFSLDNNSASEVFKLGQDLLDKCPETSSLVPHSTYSVSNMLYDKISRNNKGEVLSIHNQEGRSENSLFIKGKGTLYNFLKDFGDINITGKSALCSALSHLPKRTPIILVHNTFTSKEDVKWALENDYYTYYCTCPKANLYIEGDLPDYSIFDTNLLCVGTDSLASNNTLSILEELRIIKEKTDFNINTLLKIGCKNGAEALGMNTLGTFEPGKVPGVNLIKDFSKLTVIN